MSNTNDTGQALDVEQPEEGLVQTYQNPAGKTVPPGVAIIMLKDGTFWEGTSEGVANPVTSTLSLTGGATDTLFSADPDRNGARILNYLSVPLYIGRIDPVAEGPPSDFCPAATMDEAGVIWPAQYNFDFPPKDEWFIFASEAGDITLITW